MCSFQIVQEYERAVIFRLGRVLHGGAKGPGTCNIYIYISACPVMYVCGFATQYQYIIFFIANIYPCKYI